MSTRKTETMRRPGLRLLALLGMAACAGCADPFVVPNTTLLPENRPYVYRDEDWGRVLREHVTNGLVDYDGLSSDREPLERYYALLSVTGPGLTSEQFTARAQQTTYWLNAYNALVLVAVMERYPVTTMYDLSVPVLEHHYRFSVDGQVLNLAAIEKKLLETSNGDARTLLATSRAAMGTPRLTDAPFRAETLDRQLSEAASRALDNLNVLRVDHATRSILVWQLILRREIDFVAFWKKQRRVRTAYLFNVLLELAPPERRRSLQSAVGYTLRQVPFDRRLNRWPLSGAAGVVP